MTSLWLYLHFPLLPLEVLYDSDKQGPAALLDERRAKLWMCNADAEHQGLKAGMAMATACSLCPEVQLLNRQPQQEPQQLESLALWAGRFSAQVSLQSDHGLLLEIASMLPYFKGFQSLYQHLCQQLQALGFSSRTATGHTPLAARLLARSNGFISTEVEAHQQAIAQLPVNLLELSPRDTERLTGMGLFQIQQLFELPRDELASRLGGEILQRLDRLTGLQPDPVNYFSPPPQFQQRLDLSHEVENSQGLLFPLKRLLAALEGYLYQRQLSAQQLQLDLFERTSIHDDAPPPQRLTLNHGDGEYRSEFWMELWRLRFERLQLQHPIIALALSAERFSQQSSSVNDLFQHLDEQTSATPQKTPQQLLTRLQSRLGEQAIKGIGLRADHRPELSWQHRDLLARKGASSNGEAFFSIRQRPGWLLKSPRSLPSQHLQQQIIQLLQGPERIVSGWWDEIPVRRDYYVARWPDGRLGWLFRDHLGNWFLHGWFG